MHSSWAAPYLGPWVAYEAAFSLKQHKGLCEYRVLENEPYSAGRFVTNEGTKWQRKKRVRLQIHFAILFLIRLTKSKQLLFLRSDCLSKAHLNCRGKIRDAAILFSESNRHSWGFLARRCKKIIPPPLRMLIYIGKTKTKTKGKGLKTLAWFSYQGTHTADFCYCMCLTLPRLYPCTEDLGYFLALGNSRW